MQEVSSRENLETIRFWKNRQTNKQHCFVYRKLQYQSFSPMGPGNIQSFQEPQGDLSCVAYTMCVQKVVSLDKPTDIHGERARVCCSLPEGRNFLQSHRLLLGLFTPNTGTNSLHTDSHALRPATPASQVTLLLGSGTMPFPQELC